VSDPLPPAAALPLTEGENQPIMLPALISPSYGGDASEEAVNELGTRGQTLWRNVTDPTTYLGV